MGQKRMKCVRCGNENINEILVTFECNGHSDTTTLSKFLYYLEHPDDKRAGYDPDKIGKVLYYSCHKFCSGNMENKVIEGKESNFGLRIPSRRYGI